MTEQLARYRNLVTLPDGTRILLRPLLPEDSEDLVKFFTHISDNDRRYVRDDINDKAMVAGWAKNVDYAKVFPLISVLGKRIVGNATLHFRKGARRHQGELRIYLAHEVRRRGLGTRMLQSLIDLARSMGLHQLIAEIVTDQGSVIKAFEELGFSQQCKMPDYFILPDGSTRDVVLMTLALVQHRGEF